MLAHTASTSGPVDGQQPPGQRDRAQAEEAEWELLDQTLAERLLQQSAGLTAAQQGNAGIVKSLVGLVETKSRSNASNAAAGSSPIAVAAATSDPRLTPAIRSKRSPAAYSSSITPRWANARAPPPERTIPSEAARKPASGGGKRRLTSFRFGHNLDLARLKLGGHRRRGRRAEYEQLTSVEPGRLADPCRGGRATRDRQNQVSLAQAQSGPLVIGVRSAPQHHPVRIALSLVDRGQLTGVEPCHRPVHPERISQPLGDIRGRHRLIQGDDSDCLRRRGRRDRRPAGRQRGSHRARETEGEARRLLDQGLERSPAICFAYVLASAVRRGSRVLVLAHRVEILEQIEAALS